MADAHVLVLVSDEHYPGSMKPAFEPFMKLLHQSQKFAFKHHKKQERDGDCPLPYFTHPADVVNILRYEALETDPEVLAAGFLHDVIEETAATLEELEEKFGPRVTGLVMELTRDEPSDEVRATLDEKELWELRSQLLLDGVARMSPEAQRVKLADRVSNLRGSRATRKGEKLDRYLRQSKLILERIPRDVSPQLWDLVASLSGS